VASLAACSPQPRSVSHAVVDASTPPPTFVEVDAGPAVTPTVAASTASPPDPAPHTARKPDLKRIASLVDQGLREAKKCEVDRIYRGRTFPVKIVVSNDGHMKATVVDINLSRPDDDFEELWGAPRGDCIPEQFAYKTVDPFDGERVVIERRLTLP